MSQQSITPTIVQCASFLLLKESEDKFILVNPYVGAGNVLVGEDKTLLQALTAMQHSQAETLKQTIRASERITTLYMKCVKAGVISPDESETTGEIQ